MQPRHPGSKRNFPARRRSSQRGEISIDDQLGSPKLLAAPRPVRLSRKAGTGTLASGDFDRAATQQSSVPGKTHGAALSTRGRATARPEEK